ncbi:hypothetical protein [Paucilactobacillus kaifaensis]|nr:hypothetical protein [Paucilactobacillus kaifaensis]
MKVRLEQDDNLTETQVIIRAPINSDEAKIIKTMLDQFSSTNAP